VRTPAKAAIVAFAVTAACARSARAEGTHAVRTLSYDTATDVVITTAAGLWLVTSELSKGDLAPAACRWCDRAKDGSDALNGVDRWARRHLLWKDTRIADVASSVLAFVVAPTTGIVTTSIAAAHDGASRDAPIDGLLVAEATLVAGGVNQITKFVAGRERPFVHYLARREDGLHDLTDAPEDDHLSFFSGHAALSFAIATSRGTVATMRDYRLAPLVWAGGLSWATAIGYLRIAADKHYLTDVLAGALVGSAIGVAVPRIFHAPIADGRAAGVTASAAPASGPAVVTPWAIGGVW